MPMKMGWRWYGEGNDPITLNDIKQIPGVTSIVWALHNKMPGEIWEIDEIQKVADPRLRLRHGRGRVCQCPR
jgi:mannonate dehydratase